MTHTYLRGRIFECEVCGEEYEDHPQAFEPHLCERCEDDEDDAARERAFPNESLETGRDAQEK